ncbi:MAG: hypothetical protein O2975_03940 [Proteobacteria bacterium]|nr:hypothetical protein [Pseudomonadota bacterium]
MTDPSPSDVPAAEQTLYERFDTEAQFQAALDRLFALPGRELRIFDPNFAALRSNSPARIAMFENFLRTSRTRRIQVVLHDTGHLRRESPRMMRLLARYSHVIQVNQTQPEIRNLQDAFLVLDAAHYVRRPVARFFRGGAGVNDETDALAMRARFLEIWAASYPAVSATTIGL